MKYAFKGTCNRKYGVSNWLKGTRSIANNYEYSGSSVIIDCLGDEISNLPKNKIDMIEATLDKNNQEKVRENWFFLMIMMILIFYKNEEENKF